MRTFWITLGTILAAVWGVNNALQYATGQAPVPIPGSAPQPAPTGPVPARATLVAQPAPAEGGGATFFYTQPTFTGAVSMYGGEGQNEEMLALSHRDAELEFQVQQTVAQYSDPNTESSARQELREKLADLLGQQFNARQERRELEIKQIEERVRKLREALDKRTSAKDKIIERRLNDLLTDAEGLGWGDAAPGTPGYGTGHSIPYGPGMRGSSGGSPYGYGPAPGPGRGREGGGSPNGSRSGARGEGGSGGRYGGYPQPAEETNPRGGEGGESSQNDPVAP